MSRREANRVQDWYETLDEGMKWEEKLENRLETVLMVSGLERISFDENPEAQLSGIDMVLSQESPDIDVKVRDNEGLDYDDILIETWSVCEDSDAGWFYTSESDLIARVYKNEAGTNLVKGFFIVMTDGELHEWFNDNIETFDINRQKTVRDGERWHSECREVPIEDFPPGTLVEFDPTLNEPVEDEQQELSDWVGGDDD